MILAIYEYWELKVIYNIIKLTLIKENFYLQYDIYNIILENTKQYQKLI